MFETIISAKNVESLLQAVGDIPVLVTAGAGDSLVSLESCQAMASKLLNSNVTSNETCNAVHENINIASDHFEANPTDRAAESEVEYRTRCHLAISLN
ncbi:hypothetical protein JHK82_050692 [Glycine max]|nr:hypothetical protein JHK86_050558 [Glycine max]KAG4924837.1 hypothetical protein JHK87_050377 [Glycine soja]KAG4936481.1 hypothetical protein JHK85_051400 [Glycine max]KAG5091914.1 hypothetical protein JHK82_050692 [Glycine max]KAG5095007.1 hypothetical protein JHK84_050595 [Glycine max]